MPEYVRTLQKRMPEYFIAGITLSDHQKKMPEYFGSEVTLILGYSSNQDALREILIHAYT